MNWNLLGKKILGRPTCICEKGVVIHRTARISNCAGENSAIQIGAFSHVKGELLTFGHGGEIQIGNYCFIGEQARVWSARRVEIGSRVLISHNVNIFDNLTHPIGTKARHDQFKEIITTGQPRQIDLGEDPVTIEDDVLIGCYAIVLRGITIGSGAIIGAGSVVMRDVPPYVIAAGNPARVVREITPDER
jgi:acetyltransferase-like isoleucine patch superfamily enzyme